MPNLTSMKRTKAEEKAQKERCKSPCEMGGDPYPYGLCIRLEKESLKKLGLKLGTLKVGDEFEVTAIACVKSLRMSEGKGNYESSEVELQIEQLGLEKQTKSLSSAIDDGIKEAKS